MTNDWRLWFIQLSGWPAFLVVVALAVVFAAALSVATTRLGNRSILQAALLAALAVAMITVGVVAILTLATRMAR